MNISTPCANRAATRANLSACIAALLAASAPALAVTPATAADGPLQAALRANRPGGAALATPRAQAIDSAAQPSQLAGEVVVTSCADDDGFDTLRHAVLVANSGDTVNMSGLTCGTITLQSGAIAVGLPNLTIVGPGAGKLTIDGAGADRVFLHTGLGTLTLNDLTVAHGNRAADKAYGGCIYSANNVTLTRTVVTSCTATGQSIGFGGGIVVLGGLLAQFSRITDNHATAAVGTMAASAGGGGAFAAKNLSLIQSVVSGNVAQAPMGKVYGGGLVELGTLTMKYSTITDNLAASAGTVTEYGAGGGIFCTAAANIFGSTIDHNTADAAGGLQMRDDAAMSTAAIRMSTISSNVGTLGIGAMASQGQISILGSTIAFNTSGATAPVNVQFIAAANLQSTIIADNSPSDLVSSIPVTGGKNLIKLVYPGTVVPGDTIVQDPNLLPLALNGGVTRTHALGPGSPAIDNGSNGASYAFDQRGPTYPRTVGGTTDIGAYEVDTDHIFGTAMDFPLAF